MRKLTARYQDLRNLIPFLNEKPKPSKHQILLNAIKYIKALEGMLNEESSVKPQLPPEENPLTEEDLEILGYP